MYHFYHHPKLDDHWMNPPEIWPSPGQSRPQTRPQKGFGAMEPMEQRAINEATQRPTTGLMRKHQIFRQSHVRMDNMYNIVS